MSSINFNEKFIYLLLLYNINKIESFYNNTWANLGLKLIIWYYIIKNSKIDKKKFKSLIIWFNS